MMITLTETAAERVKSNLAKRGKGLGIRVGVKTTGCSGLAYVLEYVDNPPVTRDQFVYESNGVKVWVDDKSLVYVNGLEMNWVRQGLNEGFEFTNPNEKAKCGCGESFSV
ncbi:MAG: iron-sulfur cluster assembly protein IscA [Actinobacteria bacterium]|nr:iron-sulfur cluster assembly protein IscA [Actinomycetota bacterium]